MILNNKTGEMTTCICDCTCKTRLTKQRKIILEALKKTKTHPTAEEIFKVVKAKLPRISLATIYRNLDFLEKDNQILKLKHKNKEQKAQYDGFTELHYHLICKNCGKIKDIKDCGCILLDKKGLSNKYGFEVDPTSIEIMGTCNKCKKSNK